jgi:hypothetical protein
MPKAANAQGLFWEESIPFLSAQRTDTTRLFGVSSAEPFWGEGEAKVVWFPANAEPASEGVIVRVMLTNRSNSRQTWFIMLAGGMEGGEGGGERLHITKDPDSGAPLIRHESFPLTFALAARSAPFSQQASLLKQGGMRNTTARLNKEGFPVPIESLSAEDKPELAQWGQLSIENITLAAGETRILNLVIGAGKESESALESAQTLLGLVEDVLPNGKPRAELGLATQAEQIQNKIAYKTGNTLFDGLIAQSLFNTPQVDMRRVGTASRTPDLDNIEAGYYPALAGLEALAWIPVRPEWAIVQANSYLLAQLPADRAQQTPQSLIPTSILALWELFQETRDRDLLAKGYPSAKRRYREFVEAGRVAPDRSLFRWSSPVARAQSQLTRPIVFVGGGNSIAPDYSAWVSLLARTMERMAEVLGLAEKVTYHQEAEATAKALNTLWNPEKGLFLPKMEGESLTLEESNSLTNLLPLLCGRDTLSEVQIQALMRHLTNPETFWSPYGLRSLSRQSSTYQPRVPGRGAVTYGLNWLLWRSLLDLGEVETAEKLAENLLGAYLKAGERLGGYPEWLNGENGMPHGARDYSGDSCLLWLLYSAYHKPGTLSVGWETPLLSHYYDPKQDLLRVAFQVPPTGGKGVILCVMARPNASYRLQGTKQGTIKTNAKGVLVLPIPKEAGLQSLDILLEGDKESR